MQLKILTITIAFLLVFSLSIAHGQEQKTRIMPLGDSITVGAGQIADNNYRVGYRQPLWLDLISGGYSVEFVGSVTSGSSAVPDFDANHEGHGGYTASQVADSVYGWLESNPADIVLLHIGTNDIGNGISIDVPTIINRVDRVLNNIDTYESTYNREITVILAQIVDRKLHSPLTSAFNIALADLAGDRQSAGDRIVLVDMEHALVYPGDMYDDFHPNLSGYAKMADMWLNKLEPLLSRQLTVQKAGTGQGTVTSLPDDINCGSTCSASLPQWTIINLTANAGYGYAFSDWTGCDSVSGNICTITLGTDRTVTAVFRLVTEVKLLSPNGGEIIQAGSEYPLSWEAPREATKFKLSSSPGGKIGIVVSENAIMWDVPLVKKNITKGFVKVTAYDSSNKKVGFDTSDSIFTIEGARITFPNEGNTCVGGETCTITWTKSENVPAVSAELSYSLNDGRSWKKIPEILPGDAGALDWAAPVVSEPETRCKVRVVLKGSNGRKVGSDESDGAFTIQPAP